MQSIYSISITGASGSAPADGFIDNTTVEQYLAAGGPAPTDVAHCLAKARANFRYKLLCQQMSLYGNIYTSEMVATGADTNTPATTFSFVATVEHGVDSLYTYDETNNNALLTGTTAFTRMIARALIASETTELMYVDPTTSNAPGQTTAYARVGSRFATETIGAVAANLTAADALITVTQIA